MGKVNVQKQQFAKQAAVGMKKFILS